MKRLVIIGAGGLGKEVLWAASNRHAQEPRYIFCGFCDDTPLLQTGSYCDLPLLGAPEKAAAALAGEIFFICAVGNNQGREKLVARAEKLGWKAETVIDPSVPVARGVSVGEGSYIGALAILSPSATLGKHVVVNHASSIGHDSRLGDFSQVCPGGRISGFAEIGTGAFIGSNGVVAPGVKIGEWARLGATSLAMRDVPKGATAVGNPARVVFSGEATPNLS